MRFQIICLTAWVLINSQNEKLHIALDHNLNFKAHTNHMTNAGFFNPWNKGKQFLNEKAESFICSGPNGLL